MNDLDLIRSFRADVPAPTAAASAAARRAWSRPARRPPRWTVRAAIAGGLAVAATVVALTVPGGNEGRLGTPVASAAETLRLAAAQERGGLAEPLNAGQFWYVKRKTAWSMGGDGGYTVIQPAVREDWVGVDGARHWRTRPDGPMRFPGPRDRVRWEKAGRPSAGGASEHRAGPPRQAPFYDGAQAVTYAQLLDLPRDPRALYQRLRAAAVACGCGHSVDSETFVIAGDMLRDAPLPADLRAAVLRAAALIPGIEPIGNVRDVAGRAGVGVGFTYANERNILIFDDETHELLGESTQVVRRNDANDAAPGAVVSGSANLESAVVGSLDTTP